AAFKGTAVVVVSVTKSGLVFVSLADVKAKDVAWVWEERIPRGKLSLIAGMPDVNKSTLLLDLFARITGNGKAPANEGMLPRGDVVLLTAEDDLEDTVKPRFQLAGGDPNRMRVITMVKPEDQNYPVRYFDLTRDIARLEDGLKEFGNVI